MLKKHKFPRSNVGRAVVEAFLFDKMPPALVAHRHVRIRTMIEVETSHASLLVDPFEVFVVQQDRLLHGEHFRKYFSVYQSLGSSFIKKLRSALHLLYTEIFVTSNVSC